MFCDLFSLPYNPITQFATAAELRTYMLDRKTDAYGGEGRDTGESW